MIEPAAPLVLFVWGVKRVLPVQISSMSIAEDFFDGALNPLRAKVHLEMRVLNYYDLGLPERRAARCSSDTSCSRRRMATIQGVGTIANAASSAAGSITGSISATGSVSI